MALSRYTPKLVVLDLNPEEMYYRELHYDRLNVLAPYYQDYPEVRDIYYLKGIRDRKPGDGFLWRLQKKQLLIFGLLMVPWKSLCFHTIPNSLR